MKIRDFFRPVARLLRKTVFYFTEILPWHIPFTPKWTEAVNRDYKKKLELSLKHFRQLKLSGQTKRVREYIHVSEASVARNAAQRFGWIRFYIFLSWDLAVKFTFIFFPAISSLVYGVSYGLSLDLLWIFLLALIGAILIVLLFFLPILVILMPFQFLKDLLRFDIILTTWTWLFVSLLWVMFFSFSEFFIGLSNFKVFSLFTAILTAAICLSLVAVAALINKLAVSIIDTLQHRKNPRHEVTHGLVTLINDLRESQGHWSSVAEHLQILEKTAAFLDETFRHVRSYKDPSLAFTIKEIAKRATMGITSIKKDLLFQKRNSRAHLRRRLRKLLLCIIEENWGDLDLVEDVNQIPLRQKVVQWIGRTIAAIGQAIFPLFFFLLLEAMGLVAIAPVRDYVITALVIWAVLTVIAVFDQTANQKAEILKSVSGPLSLLQR